VVVPVATWYLFLCASAKKEVGVTQYGLFTIMCNWCKFHFSIVPELPTEQMFGYFHAM
jgi:hypothetical protein